MRYTIKQGNHYASPRCLLCLPKTLTGISKTVVFEQDCFYDPAVLGTDAKDINKLFGFSYGLFNTDSLRVGWRSTGTEIEIIAYLHVDGKRYQETYEDKNGNIKNKTYMSSIKVKPNKEYFIMIALEEGTSNFIMYVREVDTNREHTIRGLYPHGGIRAGWEMGIYFGGNKSAPNEMHISY